MRNLGGSVGIAMLSYFLTEREHYHFSVIGERLTQNSLEVAESTDADRAGLRGPGRRLGCRPPAGPGAAAGVVRREAM